MALENQVLHIVGVSDTFIFEILDVAVLLGMQPHLVPSDGYVPCDVPVSAQGFPCTNVDSIIPESLSFTGEDSYPSLIRASLPERVLVPFRELVEFQIRRGLTNWINLIHPQSWVSPSARLGSDILIGANSSVGANSQLGQHVRVNRNVSVGHDVSIEDGAIISPGSAISSGASVGAWAYVGVGAIILNDVRIGPGAIVGAGSVVTKDVAPATVVVGNPAKPLITN